MRIGLLLEELIRKLDTDKGLVIVETGTIRNAADQYANGDGHSTYHIALLMKDRRADKHRFYSLDHETAVANAFLIEKGLREFVTLVRGDSLQELARFSAIDFAYLDSANDAAHILAEFKIVEKKMVPGNAVVVIDDVCMGSKAVVKGHLVIPYAREKGYDVLIRDGQAVIKW